MANVRSRTLKACPEVFKMLVTLRAIRNSFVYVSEPCF